MEIQFSSIVCGKTHPFLIDLPLTLQNSVTLSVRVYFWTPYSLLLSMCAVRAAPVPQCCDCRGFTASLEITDSKSSNIFLRFPNCSGHFTFFAFPYKVWNNHGILYQNSSRDFYWHCIESVDEFGEKLTITLSLLISKHGISQHLFRW